jgi:hypothetical protein
LLAFWRSMTKIAGSRSGSISQRHGSPDPDPHQSIIDPEHCSKSVNSQIWKFLCLKDWFRIHNKLFLSDRFRIPNTADRSPIVGRGGQWAGGGRTQREPSERPPPAEQVGRHKILFI